jgi:DNA-binding protein HU-beta
MGEPVAQEETMANISKADLVKTVAADTGVSAKDAKAIIDAFLVTTQTHLPQGDTVQITGFGSFEVRARSARTGVKPGTSEKIEIPVAKYPAFKAGKSLKDSLK